MIELKQNQLHFSFPEVHPGAKFTMEFQRTLRIPDDENDYPLPPGLGKFPVEHVDDHAETAPSPWLKRGGVMLPIFQSEAMWLNFDEHYISERETSYPFAVKVAAGKINAVTGDPWTGGPPAAAPQDYLVIPEQPWLDGYCVEEGFIRQFVAMPLGSGYSAEEQITGEAEHGGVQIQVFPMKREIFEKRFPVIKRRRSEYRARRSTMDILCEAPMAAAVAPDMGLAPGGRMRQEIYEDPFGLDEWDIENTSRCFVHLANSLVWRAITGAEAPATPATSAAYTNAGLPWFEYYDDNAAAVHGSGILGKLKSVAQLGTEKGDVPLPENEPVDPENIVHLRVGLKKHEVREGAF